MSVWESVKCVAELFCILTLLSTVLFISLRILISLDAKNDANYVSVYISMCVTCISPLWK